MNISKTCRRGIVVILFMVSLFLPSGNHVLAYANTDERPVFLSWPLSPEIGVKRIPQYPNTPWSWHYLGLNPGYQCPPMFGYLDDWPSRFYWRDATIPEDQDRLQADPHNFKMVACYSTAGQPDTNGHEGTDIKAPPDSPVYAAAPGRVLGWKLLGNVTYLILKHCLGGEWNDKGECTGGQQWYTTYMHMKVLPEFREGNHWVARGEQVGTIYDQGDNSHLHFEVGVERRLYDNFVNPWGRDQAPWDGCMWLDRTLCPYPDVESGQVGLLTSRQELKLAVPGTSWSLAASNVVDFAIQSDRVVALDSAGKLWAQQRGYSGWVLQAEDPRAFALTPQLMVLTKAGDLIAQQGSIFDQTWERVATGVKSFSAEKEQLAIQLQNGTLLWRTAADGLWQEAAPNARAFHLSAGRLAWLEGESRLGVREAGKPVRWLSFQEPIRAFQWAGPQLLVLFSDGHLWLVGGPRRDQHRHLNAGVRSFQYAAPQLILLHTDGSARLYFELGLDAHQLFRFSDLSDFQLGASLPAMP